MKECLFCKIASGNAPAKILHSDEHVVAFRDIHPQAPHHVLVVPRRHVDTLAAVPDDPEGVQVLGHVMMGVRKVAETLGLTAEDGYRVVINCGERAGQSVFHLHAHLLGGRVLGWPPG